MSRKITGSWRQFPLPTMSKIELLAKIELLNKYEAMIEEMKDEADTIRNSISV